MATPTPISPGSRRPFDALDTEWAMLCRRHRRSTVVADWARRQPALGSLARLGDVIPPPASTGVPTARRWRRWPPGATTWRRGRCCSCSFPAWYAWRPGGAGNSRA